MAKNSDSETKSVTMSDELEEIDRQLEIQRAKKDEMLKKIEEEKKKEAKEQKVVKKVKPKEDAEKPEKQEAQIPEPYEPKKKLTSFLAKGKQKTEEEPKQEPEVKRPRNMGQNAITLPLSALKMEHQKELEWLLKSKNTGAGGFMVPKAWHVEYGQTNRAIICKGNMPMRDIPFSWYDDIDTNLCWAIFDKNLFLGKKSGGFATKIYTLLIPFDKSPDMCDYSGKTYIAKFDEVSERQISFFKKDSFEEAGKRMEDRLASSELEQLRTLLVSQTKAKTNWSGIIKIIIIIAVLAFIGYFLLKNPSWVTNLAHSIK